MKYRLTDAASRDILEIARHIRIVQKSPQNAGLVVSRLKQQFRQLVELPQLGHPRTELGKPHLRVVQTTGLLVIYDPTSKPIGIVRVIHAGRDLGKLNIP
jgi:antitoxin ParD1/3/4/toxin ParE1/3/4